jgi:pSer/pThr/pTyr-binding forkhead associated (FHA) protein
MEQMLYQGKAQLERRSSECVSDIPRRVKTRLLNFENLNEYEVPESNLPRNRDIEKRKTDKVVHGVLKIVDGPGRGSSYPIKKERITIGRDAGQDVYLPFDDTISRDRHAIINYVLQKNEFVLIDGQKPNPIRLNGIICKRKTRIDHGDILQIGLTTLLFHRTR